MIELSIDHPVPELIAAEDPSTLRAIDEGIAQLDNGHGIPLEELRQELARAMFKVNRVQSNRFPARVGRFFRNLRIYFAGQQRRR
jgi:hypothetical protein